MLAILSRRGVLARSVAALLGWAGLPTAQAQAAPACPHPLHRPLFADRPGPGSWFKTYLRLACPLCHETVHQRGFLPSTSYTSCDPALSPEEIEALGRQVAPRPVVCYHFDSRGATSVIYDYDGSYDGIRRLPVHDTRGNLLGWQRLVPLDDLPPDFPRPSRPFKAYRHFPEEHPPSDHGPV